MAAEVKNFDSPDETRPFEGKGQAKVVQLAGHAVVARHVRAGLEVVGERQAHRRDRLLPGRPFRLRALRQHAHLHG